MTIVAKDQGDVKEDDLAQLGTKLDMTKPHDMSAAASNRNKLNKWEDSRSSS